MVFSTVARPARPAHDRQTRRSDAFDEYCGLKQLTDERSDWFLQNSETGDCPSDSVIRKRLSPLWH
ncbi:MAG: hypothetical protein FKY71_15245, partial [Spiribacter salinus]